MEREREKKKINIVLGYYKENEKKTEMKLKKQTHTTDKLMPLCV